MFSKKESALNLGLPEKGIVDSYFGTEGVTSIFSDDKFGVFVGCWIIYKVVDNQVHELVAYELMSANDVPERDPMDWYDFFIRTK